MFYEPGDSWPLGEHVEEFLRIAYVVECFVDVPDIVVMHRRDFTLMKGVCKL